MKINSCACFLIISGILFVLSIPGYSPFDYQGEIEAVTLTFSHPELRCNFPQISNYTLKTKTPSLESFIRASTAMEDQELRLSGLAVFSKLANACQPLADVSKAKIQVNKMALIRLANETVCPLQGLVEHAQNAGYSVLIYFNRDFIALDLSEMQLQDKLLIPILSDSNCFSTNNYYVNISDDDLLAADRTDVEIAIKPQEEDLKKMQQYLRRLYYWFLLGPLITLEWLRRRKKPCCMSVGQQADGGRVPDETTVESGLNSAADYDDTQRNYNQEAEHQQTRGETQPLLLVCSGHTRPRAIRRVLNYLRKLFGKLGVGSGYVILIIVALPVGISSGGWSFFRFDQNENQQKTFWGGLIAPHYSISSLLFWLTSFLPQWWSPLQIFCFFLYSRFACKTTWTVPTNFSKLIRSDWFASNMYLFILGVVVPYCSIAMTDIYSTFHFAYFATYNMVCTISNLIFIIILNKHKFVTRYVFYISVCMICAYIESDIVAVFYFMLNSKGSLTNLKLTALRTAAIGLTLTLSLSSSMHIIRKLTKPRESLFEGLAEK